MGAACLLSENLGVPTWPVTGEFLNFGEDFTVIGQHIESDSIDYALTFGKQIDSSLVYFQASGEIWNRAYTFDFLAGFQYGW